MKKIVAKKLARGFALLLTLVLTAGLLAGCGDKPTDRPKNKDATPTVTKPAEATPTKEPNPEVTPTEEPGPTEEPTPTGEPTPEATPTEEPAPTEEPTLEATPTEEPTPEATPTEEPAPTGEPTSEVTPTAEPVPTEEPTPEVTPTDVPADTPTPVPTDTPTPTSTPVPTNTPVPTKTPTPTNTPKPTNTPTPTNSPTPAFGRNVSNYIGTWYAKTVEGLESGETLCADDPQSDYRLFISAEELTFVHTTTHNLNDAWTERIFELRTSFSAEEKKLYDSWGYGVSEDYISNPTDFSKGHLLYSCVDDPDGMENALFVIDAQPDGTLKTEFVYVMDNGSFPIFTEYTFITEPAYPMGHYYEDYIGTWNLKSTAAYYCDAFEVSDEDPYDVRIVVHDDNTLDYIHMSDNHNDFQGMAHYKLRTEFSSSEISNYEKWDKAGIMTYDSTMKGWAAEVASDVPTAVQGKLVFVCTDKDDNGSMLVLSWNDYFNQLDVDVFSYDSKKKREYITYETFSRSVPYSYKPGSRYADYIGVWDATEILYADGDKVLKVDSGSMAGFEICADKTAKILFKGSSVTLKLRTKASSSDPSWYADKNLQNVVTDYSKRRLVFTCTDKNYYPNMLFVVDFMDDGTISTMQYGKNGSNTLYIPYERFQRQSGPVRTN